MRDRLLHAPALVDVDHQRDVGADRLAHQADALDLLVGVRPSTAICVFIWRKPFFTRAAAASSTLSVGEVRISAPLA